MPVLDQVDAKHVVLEVDPLHTSHCVSYLLCIDDVQCVLKISKREWRRLRGTGNQGPYDYNGWKSVKLLRPRSLDNHITTYLRKLDRRGTHDKTRENIHKIDLRKDALIQNSWAQLGMNAPTVFDSRKHYLLSEYIPSQSCKSLVENQFSPNQFKNVLELYFRIQRTAIKSRRPEILHLDPHPGNFLIDKTDNPWVIDPFCHYRKDLSLPKLVAGCHSIFLYKIAKLDIPDVDKIAYIELFLDYLSDAEIIEISMLNSGSPSIQYQYAKIKSLVLHGLRGTEESFIKDKYEVVPTATNPFQMVYRLITKGRHQNRLPLTCQV